MVEKSTLGSAVEYMLLAVTYISVLTCLIRTDYNFAFAIFCYYLWIMRDDRLNALSLIVINSVTIILDIIWLFSVFSVWTTKIKGYKAWNKLYNLHVFALFFSMVNILIKIGIIVIIWLYKNKSKDNEQSGLLEQNQQQGSGQPNYKINKSLGQQGYQSNYNH